MTVHLIDVGSDILRCFTKATFYSVSFKLFLYSYLCNVEMSNQWSFVCGWVCGCVGVEFE